MRGKTKILYEALSSVREWDVKQCISSREFNFTLPIELRKKIQAALNIMEENGSSHNKQSNETVKP